MNSTSNPMVIESNQRPGGVLADLGTYRGLLFFFAPTREWKTERLLHA